MDVIGLKPAGLTALGPYHQNHRSVDSPVPLVSMRIRNHRHNFGDPKIIKVLGT
jgi:hypothetical protein